MPAYATTDVPVERSQGEVRGLLQRYGATQFTFGEAIVDGRTLIGVEFATAHHRVRLRVALKPPDEEALAVRARRARTKTLGELRAQADEQEAKRVWRVIAHNLKARMVAVEEGVESFEEAFLAHLVDAGTNQTIYERLASTGSVTLDAPLVRELPAG